MKRLLLISNLILLCAHIHAQNVGVDQANPVNKLDVNGSLSIGGAYSGTSTAPANGAIIEGSVGIKTDNPQADLHVNGTVRIASLAGPGKQNAMVIADTSGDLSTQDIPVQIWSENTTSIYYNPGNVGIGFVNPSEKLHIDGNIQLADNGNIYGLDQLVGFNDLKFYGDATGGPDFRIASGGTAGMGALFTNVALNVRNISGNTNGQLSTLR